MGSTLADGGDYIMNDNDNNILVYGYFSAPMSFDPSDETALISPFGKPDLFLAKYNPEGDLLWLLKLGRISLNNGMNTGGLAVTSSNEIIIAGSFTNNVNFDPLGSGISRTSAGGKDAFLAKYNSNGELIWINTYGSHFFDFGEKVAIDEDDNIYFGIRFFGDIEVGSIDNPEVIEGQPGGSNVVLIKCDSNGNYLWNYHTFSSGNSNITAVEVGSNGKIALGTTINGDNAGIEKKDMQLTLLSANGELDWKHHFQNFDYSNEISSCLFSPDGSFIYIAGRIQGVTEFDFSETGSQVVSPLFADPFFAKYETSSGNLVYAKSIESAGIEDYTAGITTAGAAFIIVGSFDNYINFVPGNFETQYMSQGEMDLFMAAYNKDSGEFITAATFGGSGNEHAKRAFFHPAGNILITGNFSNSLDLNPEGSSIEAAGLTDIFLAEFTYQTNVGIKKVSELVKEIKIFPIPANDYLNIEFSESQGLPIHIKIVNIVGATVVEYNVDSKINRKQIDVSQFTPGVYIVEFSSPNYRLSKKFVKK